MGVGKWVGKNGAVCGETDGMFHVEHSVSAFKDGGEHVFGLLYPVLKRIYGVLWRERVERYQMDSPGAGAWLR